MKVGVAAIKGTFEGKVKLSDLEPPHRYRMAVEGSGGPGFVRGDAGMQMSDVDGAPGQLRRGRAGGRAHRERRPAHAGRRDQDDARPVL